MTNDNTQENEQAPQETPQEEEIKLPPIAPPKRRSYNQRKKLAQIKFNPLSKENTTESILDKLVNASIEEYRERHTEDNGTEMDNVKHDRSIVNVVRDKNGRLISGTPNPFGRPIGKYSLKSKIEVLLKHNPDIEARLIRDLLQKEQALIYEMIDGKPSQKVDVTAHEAPKPILAVDIIKDDTNLKDQKT